MKWGVRRYQNKDGTLTPKGKKRYGKDGGTGEASAPKRQVIKKQPVKRLTMEELQEKKNRLELEKRVLELEDSIRKMTAPEAAQTPQATRGKGFVKRVLGEAAENTGKKLANNIGEYAVDAILKKAGIKTGADELEMLRKDAERWKNQATISRNKRNIVQDQDWFAEREQTRAKKQSKAQETEKGSETKTNTGSYKDPRAETKTASSVPVHKYTRSTQKYSDVINMTKEGERYVADFLDRDPDRKFRKTY
jgi:hypothetical protein